MWISTLTYDLVSIRNTNTDSVVAILSSILSKKDELSDVDGNGEPLLGFEPKDFSDPFYQEESTTEIKRIWNTQAAAEEFASFANSAADFVTASSEEQV